MRITKALLALTVVLLSQAGAPAIGAGAERSHTTGNFAIELDGPNKGQAKSVEGGKATTEKAKEPAASTPQKKSPQVATPPGPVVRSVQPLCGTPPCPQKNEVDTKKK